MAKKREVLDPEKEKLIDTFADVFHSFKDLYQVSPVDFLEELEKAGVTIARVGGSTKP